MPVTPISPSFGSTPTTTQGAMSAATSANGLDKDTFLSLLVAQLKYQDPMNPTDSAQFLAQTAQFTSLEKMQDVADLTTKSLGAQLAFGSSAMVGRTVTYGTADGGTGTGVVSSVTFGNDGPVLDVGGTQVRLDDVRSVVQPGQSTSGSSPDGSTASSSSS